MARVSVFAFGVDHRLAKPAFHATAEWCARLLVYGLLVQVARRSYQYTRPSPEELRKRLQAIARRYVPSMLPAAELPGLRFVVGDTQAVQLRRFLVLAARNERLWDLLRRARPESIRDDDL